MKACYTHNVAKNKVPLHLSLPLAALLGALGLFASALPRRWELFLGRRFGRLAAKLRMFKRRTVEENVRRCFPHLDEAGRRALIRANYEHYGVLMFEFMHFFC